MEGQFGSDDSATGDSEEAVEEIPNPFELPSKLDLDAALHELGMLSTVTDSRLDFLGSSIIKKEKKKKEPDVVESLRHKIKRLRCSKSSPAPPLSVVHMNSDFVTQFSLSKTSTSAIDFKASSNSIPKIAVKKRRRMRKLFNPYTLPIYSPPHSPIIHPDKFEEEFKECKAKILASNILNSEEPSSPPVISRQDSGNKSNPSSPVKSQNSLNSVGCSIFRSRSLDDLEIGKVYLNENRGLAIQVEIETMSQCINNLHVS